MNFHKPVYLPLVRIGIICYEVKYQFKCWVLVNRLGFFK